MPTLLPLPCVRRRYPPLAFRCLSSYSSAATTSTHSPPSPTAQLNTAITPGGAAVTSIPQSLLSYHWETPAPTAVQLRWAHKFFTTGTPPSLIFVAGSLHQIPRTQAPEVCFLGRSNVGKSSLLNVLLGASAKQPTRQQLARTSSRPGRTRTVNGYSVGAGNSTLTILDLPGYGHGSREEWGRLVSKYLAARRQLRRVFLLVDPLHGVKASDALMLAELRRCGVSHQVVLPKADRILLPSRSTAKPLSERELQNRAATLRDAMEKIRQAAQPQYDKKMTEGRGPPALGEILACSAAVPDRWKALARASNEEAGGGGGGAGVLGVDALRWSVLSACGLAPMSSSRRIKGAQEVETMVIQNANATPHDQLDEQQLLLHREEK